MKRLFPGVVFVLLWLVPLQAQDKQPGSRSTNNNQNVSNEQMQSGAPGTEKSTSEAPPATASGSDQPASPGADTEKPPRTSEPAANDQTAEPEDETAAPDRQSEGPHTVMSRDSGITVDDSFLNPAPLPKNKVTLIGGTAKRVDGIRNRVLIQPFGGGHEVTVALDERTLIYRDGRATTILGIHRGDRLYADTMALGPKVFARTLRVETTVGPAEAHGQVVHFDPRRHIVEIRDSLTAQLVSVTVTDHTSFSMKNGEANIGDLIPGTLLDVIFAAGQKGGPAQNIHILAIPGTEFVFVGRISNIDLRRGVMAIDNESDGKNYEIQFDPALVVDRERLQVGAGIAVTARFDGTKYSAKSVSITNPLPKTAVR